MHLGITEFDLGWVIWCERNVKLFTLPCCDESSLLNNTSVESLYVAICIAHLLSLYVYMCSRVGVVGGRGVWEWWWKLYTQPCMELDLGIGTHQSQHTTCIDRDCTTAQVLTHASVGGPNRLPLFYIECQNGYIWGLRYFAVSSRFWRLSSQDDIQYSTVPGWVSYQWLWPWPPTEGVIVNTRPTVPIYTWRSCAYWMQSTHVRTKRFWILNCGDVFHLICASTV